ncbi:uncharacterized protein rbm33b isoform X1 [Astyanax mexicanus]|uniref:uncharacterized protein rbm33b isoform X1 n=1 Tax=Astyanax mexicanus TaxID=7994 RepID=UPI0020CAFA67|nr:uncharacterized protein rbm33b isoform X1 [Astyanax mexicanus]XP_022534895.2 uncharacterized protein rbm33b isoform X1 [Astyanax mexicanus]XP_022534897.2 uncharacterized protein rbm33b isoform X1 [Astyanax mexicanus]XP_049334569.1 uncharacterized protein rbm33b isoform X1 [Astyanax mexicanus]
MGNMNSDFEDGILEDNSLGALSDVWDEELSDDLLRSDEEDLTTSDVASHLGCEQEVGAPHHAEEPRRCTGEQQQQPGEKPDHGEVFDIPINDPDEFQELTRETVRPQQQKQQQGEEEEENSRDEEESSSLQASAADTVIHSSSAASEEKILTEALGLCEEARPAFWGRLNKHEGLARERSGTQMDTQFHPCNGCPGQKAQREFCLQIDAVCSQSSVSSLPPLLMELQSTGASPQQVPLTSTQSPANPAVDPSSLQVVADSSRPLHEQTIPAGSHPVFPGQHMFGQQHHTSELDGSPLLHDPVSTGAAGRPGCSGDPRGPLCSPQRNLGLPSLNSSHPAPLCVPGEASLQPVPSVIAQHQPCDTQPFHPDQALSLLQTPPVLHPNPEQSSQSSLSPVQAPPSAWLPSVSVESQSSPLSRPAPICCAVIKPRMQVQISPNVSHVLSDRPVLAHNSSFINVARPTPTPAAQVRPIARAVATGMPGAARQQASARAGVCARAVLEPVLAGKSRGQEVKEEPQSPLSSLSKEEREEEEEEEAIKGDTDSLCQHQTDNDSKDGVPAWYRLQLEKQKHLRQKLIGQKEERRQLQAEYRKKQRQDKLKNALQNHDQKPQDGRQAQNIKKPSQKPPASNILPLLRPPPKPGYPPAAPLAQCPAAAPAALVERAAPRHGNPFPWHGFHGRGDEGSGVFSGVPGERHGRRRRRKWMAGKRVMKELPSKVKMVKRSNMEKDEDEMNMRFPAQVSEGSRVVTFTQIPCFGPHTLRQVCPNLRR